MGSQLCGETDPADSHLGSLVVAAATVVIVIAVVTLMVVRVVVMLVVVVVVVLLIVAALLMAVIAEHLIHLSHCFKSSTCVISMVKSKFLHLDVWV